MAFTEETTHEYEIKTENKVIYCYDITVVKKDGIEISRSCPYHIITPVSDLTEESDETKALVATIHTPAVVDAYKVFMASQPVTIPLPS
jgi:hypothetical protein